MEQWNRLVHETAESLKGHRCNSCNSEIVAWYSSHVKALNADCSCGCIRMDGLTRTPPWASENAESVLKTLTGEVEVKIIPPKPTLEEIDADRGELVAGPLKNGWILCPYCTRKFKPSCDTSWDGERHLTCGTSLVIK